MDLPTYTNIWRIEKRLYKLYDLRLPMPLPINWIAVFAGITIPYIVLLIAIGVPLNHDLLWLYVLPPGVLTWATTRPVLESKRLPELVESQARYLTEPRTWVRLQPLSEKDQMVLTARIYHPRAKRPAAARPPTPAIARQALPAAEQDRQASPLRPAPGPVLKPTSVFRPEPGQAVAQGPVRGRRGPAVPPRARAQERARGPVGDQERVRVRERSGSSGLGPGTPRRAPELPPVRPVQSARPFIPVIPAAAPEPSGLPAHAMPDVVPTSAALGPAPAPAPQPARGPRLAPSPRYAPAPQPAPGPQSASGSPSAPVRAPESAPPPGPAAQPAATFRPAPVRPAPPADSPAAQAPSPSDPAPQLGPTGVPARARAGRPGGGSLEVSHDGPRRRPGAGQAPSDRPVPPVQPARPASPGPQSPVQSPVEQGPAVPLTPAAPVLDWPVAARPLRPVPSTPEEGPAPATPADPAAHEETATTSDEHQAPADPAPAAPAAAVFVPAAPGPQAPAPAVPPHLAATAATPAPRGARSRGARRGRARPGRAPGPRRGVARNARVLDRQGRRARVVDTRLRRARVVDTRLRYARTRRARTRTRRDRDSSARRAGAAVPGGGSRPGSRRAAASVAPPAEAAPPPPAQQRPAPRCLPKQRPPPGPPRPPRPRRPAPAVQQVAEVKLPSIERALSGPSRDMNAPWGGKVKIVTGNGAMPGPGARDQEAQDRNRARLPIAEPKRILVLGCTSGAGQSVTTLMTASMLASLREHPVAAVDLHDGTLARYRAPAAWLEELLAGKPPQHIRPTRPDGLHPTPKPSPARLDVVASHEPLKEGDEIKLAVQLNRHYPLTLLDPGAAALSRLLKVTDQLVVVVPANVDAAGALADTRDWLDNNGHADLAMQSVTVINGVSRRSLPDVESAESIARGRSRAIVRVPWDDMLPVAAASPSTLRPQTRVAYTALAGVLVAGLAAAPVRKKP